MTRATRQLEQLLVVLQDPTAAREQLGKLIEQEKKLRETLSAVNAARTEQVNAVAGARDELARRETALASGQRELSEAQAAVVALRAKLKKEGEAVELARRAAEFAKQEASRELLGRETALANATASSTRDLDSRKAGLASRAERLAEIEASLRGRESALAAAVAAHESRAMKLAATLKELR